MRFENSKQGIEEIENYLRREYNPDLNIENRKRLDDKVVLNLSLTYNNFVNKNSRVSYKNITLHNVYDLIAKKVDDGEELYVSGLDYNELIENGLQTRRAYIKEMEKILAKEASKGFVNITSVRQCLRPFEEVFENVKTSGDLKLKDWDLWNKDKEKANKYLNLLKDYDFVKVEERKIKKGGGWQIKYEDDFKNFDEVKIEQLLSHFLSETYENIRSKKYGILQQSEPFFDIANSTYYTSLLNNERLGHTKNEIINIYERITGKTRKKLSKINFYLNKLVENEIIDKIGNSYYPEENIYDKFFSEKDYKMSLKHHMT